ncbi:MAG: SusC/RagA family TonB-linked outer membrane protein [Cytophagales bacterium]|nr:SusC/RagA family TonB-linked outer membrane protein [Bernardetiaceae bacterium]MDW8211701.1 SusC/RagA family TonB-linked outer membrane protein [Cytophagales bacterium]
MKRLLLLSAVWALWIGASFAQDRVISGKITSGEDNAPLPGVNVLAKGTTTGVVSDGEGRYKLSVPEGVTRLVFSFVGFQTQEVEIGNRTSIDVVMVPDTKQLSEVVVTAQGIVREKRALGYAVATVSQNAISDRPLADVGRILQGKIAGVNITQTSGVSGTGTNITIRGYSSITGSVQPLFVVDGVPFNSATNSRGSFIEGGQAAPSRFLDIDPNNIESVSVLKGLAAAVLYGDQGRNGVILITTKNASAKNKPAEIILTQSVFANRAVLPVYQNTYIGGFQQNPGYFFSNWGPSLDEYLRRQELGLSIGSFPVHPYAVLQDPALRAAFADYVAQNPYPIDVFPNNVRDFFRTGIVSNTSLNLNGGNGVTSYNVSVGYNREQGYVANNDLARLSLGLGARTQVIKGVTINTSFNFINTDVKTPPLNAGLGNNTLNGFPSAFANVMYTPRNIDLMGLPFESPVDNRSVYFRSANDIPNPRWILKYYSTPSITNRFFTSNSVILDLAENFSVTYRVGLDTYNERQEAKFNKGGVDFVNGAYFTRDIVNTIWNHDVIASYSKPVNDKLTLAGKLGANMRYDRYDEQSVRSVNQLAFGLMRHNNFIDNAASSFTQEQTRIGVYGEVTADYKNFLYANFAARNDWTSTVEIENRRIFYPSGSISFIPTTAFEGLQSSYLNELKIRTGIGTSAGFPTPYSTRSILNQNSRAFIDVSGNVFQTHTVDNFLGNPNLKPELLTEYELGVESKLFSNKIGIDFTWYRRETTNLITNTPIDPATGYTSTAVNIGKIRNTGVELVLNATPIRKENLSWETIFNFTRNVPITVELGGQLAEVVVAGFSNLGNFAVPGRPFNIIKGTAFRRDANGNRIVDNSGLYLADPVIRELGNPNPAFNTSWINTLNYKGFSFNVMLEYRHGGALYSSTAGALLGRGLTKDTEFDRSQTFILPGVKQDGTPNDIQITTADYHFNSVYFFGDEGRIFDGTTIRIREASLSYTLPKNLVSKTPFKGVSVSLQGNNIWYRAVNIPKYLRLDTDNLGLGVGNGLGFEFLTGPASRRFGGTLRLNF